MSNNYPHGVGGGVDLAEEVDVTNIADTPQDQRESEAQLNIQNGKVEVLSNKLSSTQKIITRLDSSMAEQLDVVMETENKRVGKINKSIVRAQLVEKRSVGC
mmetsp:Transcript_140/g.264  ORF Transcript_140/g.264 Transcript_140/m.264 type:complete len:102 (+) Transcript_140:3039-3344(+)